MAKLGRFRDWLSLGILLYGAVLVGMAWEGLDVQAALMKILGIFAATVLTWRASASLHEERRRPWRFFLASMGAYLFGELYRLYLFGSAQSMVAFPCKADVCYLISAILSFAAICLYLRQGRMLNLRAVMDGVLAMVAPAVLILHYIILPLMEQHADAGRIFFILALYVVYTLNLAGMMFILFFSNRRRYLNRTNLYLGLGLSMKYLSGCYCLASAVEELPLEDFAVLLALRGICLWQWRHFILCHPLGERDWKRVFFRSISFGGYGNTAAF